MKTLLSALSRRGWLAATFGMGVLGLGLTSGLAIGAEEKAQTASAVPAAQASAELHVGNLRVGKVLFLGNSITWHGPAPKIGWDGNWGMAASAQEKDYVHLLLEQIAKSAGGKPAVMIKNIADFERRLMDFDLKEGLKQELVFEADLIIVAIGENAAALKTEEDKAKYREAFSKLLAELKKKGRPTLVVRSSFWADPAKDQIMKQACEDAGGVFVDNSKLGSDESNFARSERKIEHAGVAGHPGDKGMQAIADAVWNAIQKRAAIENPPVFPIGSRRELFVENSLVDRLTGKAELRLHHPVPQEVVLEHGEPWEGSGSVYHSIFKDGDRYRMYYAAGQLTVTPRGVDAATHGQFCCYAESDDGIRWRKPALGLHEFQGNKANNIVMIPQKIGDATSVPGEPAVFKDENPDAPLDARYKALLPANRLPHDHRRGLLAFKSPDGLHWSPMSDRPILTDGAFDSQNLAFWDAEHGHYRAYWRYFTKGGYDEKVWNPQGDRAIRTATSKDFLHWQDQADLRYVDSPSEQLYTSQVKPYYRAPHLLIGFPTRYVERGHNDGPDHEARASAGPERTRHWSASLRALPELENREWRAKASERYGRALTEGLLMASRDGVTFKRWNEGFLRPGIERKGTWNYGHQFIGWSPVETKGTLEGAPNELSLYAVESYWTDNSDLLRRYSLRLDGFVSAHAPMSGGELVTRPLTFSGKLLSLNLATSAAGSVKVELQDTTGRPLPGYSLDDCEELFGDTLDRSVTWKTKPMLSALAGHPVRVRFVLRDADLYSFQFRD